MIANNVSMTAPLQAGSPGQHKFETWELALLTTVMILIMILAIAGNTLVCLCIYMKQEMRTVTAMFLVNLALADLGTGLFCVPMAIAAIFDVSLLRNDFTCTFNAFCIVLFFVASINTLAAASIYKYISVGFPMSRKVTKQGAFVIIFFIWLLSLLLAAGPVFGWSHYYLVTNRYQCSPKSPESITDYSHLAALFAFGYALPLPVMTFCYARVYCISMGHFKRMRRNTIYDLTLLKSETHLIATLWIVLIVFTICWLPFVVYLMRGILQHSVPIYLPIIAFTFGYCNSSLNPLVYTMRLASFRRGFKEIITKCFKGEKMKPAYLTYSGHGRSPNDQANNTADTLKTSLPRDAFRKASLAYVLEGSNNKTFFVEDGGKALKSRKITRYRISETKMYPRISRDNNSGKANQAYDEEAHEKQNIDKGGFQDTVAVFDSSNNLNKSRRFSTSSIPISRLYPRLSRDETHDNSESSINGTVPSSINNAYKSEDLGDVIEEDTCDGIELKEKHADYDSDERNRVISLTETRYEMFSKLLKLCQNSEWESPSGEYQISRRIKAQYNIHVISNPTEQEAEMFGKPCIHKVLRTLRWKDVAYDSLGNVVMKTSHEVAKDEAINQAELPLYMREHIGSEIKWQGPSSKMSLR